ncbi:hypothetical protein MHBO_005259, partial [Bonamia ostreae]
MMLGYMLGAYGPTSGYNALKSFATKKNAFGSQVQITAPSLTGTMLVGADVISANEFTKYAVTPIDRNSDIFGQDIGGIMNVRMPANLLSGIRYEQDVQVLNGKMKAMFYGHKNDHDLVSQNAIGSKVMTTSMYMLTGNQH